MGALHTTGSFPCAVSSGKKLCMPLYFMSFHALRYVAKAESMPLVFARRPAFVLYGNVRTIQALDWQHSRVQKHWARANTLLHGSVQESIFCKQCCLREILEPDKVAFCAMMFEKERFQNRPRTSRSFCDAKGYSQTFALFLAC